MNPDFIEPSARKLLIFAVVIGAKWHYFCTVNAVICVIGILWMIRHIVEQAISTGTIVKATVVLRLVIKPV